MAKRGRKKGWTTEGARKAYYKSDHQGYCQLCGKQVYVKEFKTINDPKDRIRVLNVCGDCYAKTNNK